MLSVIWLCYNHCHRVSLPVVNKSTFYSTIYDGQKVTTYTTYQWYVVLEVFCVVYVGKPPTRHVVIGLPTCVVAGKPTTFCHFFQLLPNFRRFLQLFLTFPHLSPPFAKMGSLCGGHIGQIQDGRHPE